MKNKLMAMTFIAVAAGLGNNAMAQGTTPTTPTTPAKTSVLKNVAVSIEISDNITIGPTIPAGADNIDFKYNTSVDFNNDKSINAPAQFIVVSKNPYDINVKADGNFKGQTTATEEIELNLLRLSARKSMSGAYTAEITPTTADQPLFTALPSTPIDGVSYDVLYRLPKASGAVIYTKSPQKYITNLTYSVVTK